MVCLPAHVNLKVARLELFLGENSQTFFVLYQSIPCSVNAILGEHRATGLVWRDAAVDERQHGQPGYPFCTPHHQVEAMSKGMGPFVDMLPLG